ncbi:MAG TPA: hypothetical protein VGC59_16080 [Solirubrobacteraceae bacterium]
MDRLKRWPKPVLAGCAGVLAALGVASGLTQAASTTPTSPTSTTTTTTPTTTTKAPAKSAAGRTKVTCKVTLVATKSSTTAAENFGTLSCSAPLGKGVQHDTAKLTATSSTAGAYSGALTLFFDTGTLRGTYKTSFTVANKTVTYTGTLKISSGTGDFKGVTGTGTITGSSSDAVHSTLTDKLTLKIPPKKKG